MSLAYITCHVKKHIFTVKSATQNGELRMVTPETTTIHHQ